MEEKRNILNLFSNKSFNQDKNYQYVRCKYIFSDYCFGAIHSLDYFKEHGLLTLKDMLDSKDSPLCLFLNKYGIQFFVDQKLIFYNGEKFEIKESDLVWNNLYNKYANHRELFYSGTDEQIYGYSHITKCPELIQRVWDFLIKRIVAIDIAEQLKYDWIDNSKYKVYEYILPLNAIENKLKTNVLSNNYEILSVHDSYRMPYSKFNLLFEE